MTTDRLDRFDGTVRRLRHFDAMHPVALPDPPPAPPPFAPVRPSKLIGYLTSEAAGGKVPIPAGFHRRPPLEPPMMTS